MKILIIEDDPTSLKLAGIVLQMHGHVVMLAVTAEQALLSMTTVKPDAILLDLRLPGTTGLNLTRQLRAHAAMCDIAIIAVTAYPDDFAKAEALKAGCDAYIVKPIDIDTLSEEIENAVAARAKRGKSTI